MATLRITDEIVEPREDDKCQWGGPECTGSAVYLAIGSNTGTQVRVCAECAAEDDDGKGAIFE